mgnify:CR=1 FL=1
MRTQDAHTHLRGGGSGAEGAAHMRGTARQVPGEQACNEIVEVVVVVVVTVVLLVTME